MGTMIWSGVRERVEALARADKARKVFGAWDKHGGTGHRFRLADPLSEADVAEAEAQWRVSLPADYRAFLLEVGAGGAGPFYGLTTLSRTDAGWLWSDPGGGTVHERLRFPCPDAADSMRAQAEHERKEPVESDFEGEEAFDAAYRAWLEDEEKLSDWLLSGAVCLSHEGCGYFDWLIVSGPQRGQVLLDERAGGGRFGPLGRVGFADWYLHWVGKAEALVGRGR
ncbi:SMI1/KNR4 family protein [Streptomyces sp. SID5643]|uniref:SMI1/KNR4 family protein n=1 Tax=Streptomyces sp. SID5643 TaxID=2690307 RepID=UPI0013705003|nr:SMI1/KNR4 family protein [Streptomyces sp. SID5643]MZF90049.1 cell wall assembly protein [Streptomyces sp. SID5643]